MLESRRLRLEGWTRVCKRTSSSIPIDIRLLELTKLLWLLEACRLRGKAKLSDALARLREPSNLRLYLQLLELLLQS